MLPIVCHRACRHSGDGGSGGGTSGDRGGTSGDRRAGSRSEIGQQLGQPRRDRPGGAVADLPPVDGDHRSDPAHRAGHEDLVGRVELGQRVVADHALDAGLGGELEHRAPGDPLGARGRRRCAQHAPGHQEDVGRVGLGDEAPVVEHQGVVGAGGVGLDLGEDRGQQVGVVDLRVEAVRRRTAHARGDQGDPGRVVHRRLVLGQHDQRRPRLVQPRVHPTGDLHPPGQREPDVDSVGHVVGLQRAPDLAGDLLVRGHRVERQCLRRPPQPGQVLVQPEDSAVVDPQALPHRVAALHGGVERADRRLGPVRQAPGDVDDQVPVALVELLQHRYSLSPCCLS